MPRVLIKKEGEHSEVASPEQSIETCEAEVAYVESVLADRRRAGEAGEALGHVISLPWQHQLLAGVVQSVEVVRDADEG